MRQPLPARDFVRIHDAAEMLGVSEQTLRNWDRQGKLAAFRHPINGYRLYRVADLDEVLRALRQSSVYQTQLALVSPRHDEFADLPPCHWAPSVALDPKHRPQDWHMPATTVRRDWRKYPQEAHVISPEGRRYRRLTPEEIAVLQGIDPGVLSGPGLTDRQKIAAIGDAVPPAFSRVIVSALDDVWSWTNRTAIEICAGIGGLAEGSAAAGFEHLALVDSSATCVKLLTNDRAWPASAVHLGNVRTLDWGAYRDRVGLLSGGPPCQPWSLSGRRAGRGDERDLLGSLPDLLAVVRPEVFVFENVPGLLVEVHRPYLESLVERLRDPASGLSYGMLVAKFQIADFGIPQRRERILFVGFRDASSAYASRHLDAVAARRTHAEMPAGAGGLAKWVTVGEALGDRPDPGGWRRWLSY